MISSFSLSSSDVAFKVLGLAPVSSLGTGFASFMSTLVAAVSSPDAGEAVEEVTVGDTVSEALGAEEEEKAPDVALGAVVLFNRATTDVYCCISSIAASSKTRMFLRHLILASTLDLSVPSSSESSCSVMPEKFGGGIGGGTVNGRGGKAKGGRGNDGSTGGGDNDGEPEAPAALVDVVVVVADDEAFAAVADVVAVGCG